MSSLFTELKRRNVFKVAVAYAIVAWLLIQVAGTVLPTFNAPDWVNQVFTLFIILGFPVALILAWAFELTPEGIKPTHQVDESSSIAHSTGRKIDFVIIGVLILAVGYMFVDNYVLNADNEQTIAKEVAAPAAEPVAETPALSVPAQERGVLSNSVAVLPFENMSPDPDNDYFAAGIHEETLNRLAKLRNLSVISRTSVLQYQDTDLTIPEIATELNVETIMEGSVRYADDRVRVTAQLIDAATDEHLWSEVYERDFADIFAIQSDIAMNIANALEAEFSPDEQARIESVPTESTEAHQMVLRAWQAGGGPVTMAYLDQAIELDPGYAFAYALRGYRSVLSLSRDLRPGRQTERGEQEEAARQDLEKALELDSNTGLAYTGLAYLHERNWRGAEALRVYERAIELLPNADGVLGSYARFNAYIGRHEEAIAAGRRSVALSPNNWGAHRALGGAYEYAGYLEEASREYREGTLLYPGPGFTPLQAAVVRTQLRLGHRSAAEDESRLFEPMAFVHDNSSFLADLAYAYARLGLHDNAERALAEFDIRAANSTIASGIWVVASLARGDEEQALQWLTKTADEREAIAGQVTVLQIKNNLYGDPILDQPEFVEQRDRLGFTDI